MPGCEWMRVVYQDEEVIIRESNPKLIYPYHRTRYSLPLSGKGTEGWLCCGDWHFVNGKWRKAYSNDSAETIEGVVAIIKGKER